MMKSIDDRRNYPCGWLQLMLVLTSKLLPRTEVYKWYDRTLPTCADPKWAYMYLFVIAAWVADPLPNSQISKLLGLGEGRDAETALAWLWSVMDIPTDSSLPVNIYYSSVRDYVSSPSNCSFTQMPCLICDLASLCDGERLAKYHFLEAPVTSLTSLKQPDLCNMSHSLSCHLLTVAFYSTMESSFVFVSPPSDTDPTLHIVDMRPYFLVIH